MIVAGRERKFAFDFEGNPIRLIIVADIMPVTAEGREELTDLLAEVDPGYDYLNRLLFAGDILLWHHDLLVTKRALSEQLDLWRIFAEGELERVDLLLKIAGQSMVTPRSMHLNGMPNRHRN